MDKEYIDKLENNLSTINKSAEILLYDLDNLNITLSNIDKYNKKGFKLNNIIKEIEDHIINTEKFLIDLLEDTKNKSTEINIETNKISDNNNIFINMNNSNNNIKHDNNDNNDNNDNDNNDENDENDENICCCLKL